MRIERGGRGSEEGVWWGPEGLVEKLVGAIALFAF